jgi:hypothetical protein
MMVHWVKAEVASAITHDDPDDPIVIRNAYVPEFQL